jgi:hypothetical protein
MVHTYAEISKLTSGVPLSGGSYQSREEIKSRPVAREARSERYFFHS